MPIDVDDDAAGADHAGTGAHGSSSGHGNGQGWVGEGERDGCSYELRGGCQLEMRGGVLVPAYDLHSMGVDMDKVCISVCVVCVSGGGGGGGGG